MKNIPQEQSKSAKAYAGVLARTLNTILRKQQNNEFYKQHIENLDNLFENPMCYDIFTEQTKVFRRVRLDKYNASYFKDKIEIGKPFVELGYLSTTTNPDSVSDYEECFLEIIVPKGTKYVDMNPIVSTSKNFKKEDEVLFARGVKLLPLEFNEETNTYTMTMLPEI